MKIMEYKKSVMSQVISVFVMILVISILAGLTFLFVSELKAEIQSGGQSQFSVSEEVAVINETGQVVSVARTQSSTFDSTAKTFVVTGLWNSTKSYAVGNVTISSSGEIFNASTIHFEDSSVRINYTYFSAIGSTAYKSINDTEAAGTTVINYLPLIFLALIFGVILTLVLKIILPYINLGQQVGGF